MPELPEVEVVRAGLDPYIAGRTIVAVQNFHPRAARRSAIGLHDAVGRRMLWMSRRGKYLWAPFAGRQHAFVMHLGMSGQLLIQQRTQPNPKHLRITVEFDDVDRQLRFVDQRTFGHLMIDELTDDGHGGAVPICVSHISRDLLDPVLDRTQVVARIRAKATGIKRVLLDQSVVSGIGNIYADEALWAARIHAETPATVLTSRQVAKLLEEAIAVMQRALAQGGTSFDELYVNVNGQSGYFSRSLNAYGQAGKPCPRCGSNIQRAKFMNRSSFYCPRCQKQARA